MTDKTIRFQNTAFIPIAFIIIAIQRFSEVRVLCQTMVIALSVTVIFQTAATGVTGTARGFVCHFSFQVGIACFSQAWEFIRSEVNFIRVLVVFLRQLAE